MILQTDDRLYKEINKYGCYFMSILFLINKYTGHKWDTDKINKFYKTMVHLGYIQADDDFQKVADEDGLILRPEQIFKMANMKVEYTNAHEPPDRMCDSDEIEILNFEHSVYGGHFVVGGGKGNVAYDPWGVSHAATEGTLVSKRIFRRL